MTANNSNRLFYASCFALITTAFSFSIRAGILPELGEAFNLTKVELGFINSMWFVGFPISMVLGGIFYRTIGPKAIMLFAFVAHALGILLTILATGYTSLLVSTLLIGLGNGCTEAACNPMIADAYEGKRMNTLLNRFHMWFPGGIVLGSLISYFMTNAGNPQHFDQTNSIVGVINLLIGLGIALALVSAGRSVKQGNNSNSSESLILAGILLSSYLLLNFLVSYLVKNQISLGWQAQIYVILIPTVIYAILFWGQQFPESKSKDVASLSTNFKAMATPLFIFICACMTLTAISEFGPQQWTSLLLANSGAEPMVILALVTGLMAVGRYFGGEVVHKFDQTGVLLGSAVFTALGIYLFSVSTGSMTYMAAVLFAMGVCFFWPNMLGFVAEKIPLSGAIGMSIVGAFGMFSTSIWQPIIGGWIEADRISAAQQGLTDKALDLAAGQATMLSMTAFPLILIVSFTVLLFWVKRTKAS